MPPKGSKGKRGKGEALPPPVLEPPQSEPAQKEVDMTTNVKATKKKVVTTFNEQQKEEIIEFLWQNEILYSKRLAGFQDVNKKYARRGPVVVNIDHHRSKFPFTTYRSISHRFFMLVSERIYTYQFVTNRLQ